MPQKSTRSPGAITSGTFLFVEASNSSRDGLCAPSVFRSFRNAPNVANFRGFADNLKKARSEYLGVKANKAESANVHTNDGRVPRSSAYDNDSFVAELPIYVILKSLRILNFSIRFLSVARVMPRSFAACNWLPPVSFRAWITNSRSIAGINLSDGSRLAH